MKRWISILCFWAAVAYAQSFEWTDISSQHSQLPASVKIFAGIDTTLPVKAWYLDVDMNDTLVAVRPYLSTITAKKEGVSTFCRRMGAYAAVNGGYFDIGASGASYSAVVYPDEVLAKNVSPLTRNSKSYPVTRAFMGFDTLLQPAANWIYHFGNNVEDIYTFADPLPNHEGANPVATPTTADGTPYSDLYMGLGGGPMLIKGDTIRITYDEEVFWGSGVGLTNRDPRTAIGYTDDNHLILFVVDGRQTASTGLSLPELAQVMRDLGCYEAINLDGGGSSQIAVDNQLINRPEGGTYMRPVPTIWAVVHRDSLPEIPVVEEPLEEKIVDTGTNAPDTGYTVEVGSGWIETANSGFWGTTKSKLNAKGSGENQYVFKPVLATTGQFDLYGWWVAAPTRCTDTRILVVHNQTIDTVQANQTQNHGQWVKLGTFGFTAGDSSSAVIVTNYAPNSGSTNMYVVADAFRWVALDPSPVTEDGPVKPVRGGFELNAPYPNPFNNQLKICYTVSESGNYSLQVLNLMGQVVAQPKASEYHSVGKYEYIWSGKNGANQPCAGGIYFIRLNDGVSSQMQRVVLLH